MLEWVVDALQSSKYVERIVVVGLSSAEGCHFKRPVTTFLPDQGSLVANALQGVAWLQQHDPKTGTAVFCTADVPAISGATIDAFIESCAPFDKAIYYILVSRQDFEKRFPDSRRTFVKLKGLQVAGGDVVIADTALVNQHEELWGQLSNARKHAWKLARVVGFGVLIKFLFRQLSIAEIEQMGARIVHRPVKVVLDAPPELAMDVDKPGQIDLLRAELEKLRSGTSEADDL
jgi:hypothetical protein